MMRCFKNTLLVLLPAVLFLGFWEYAVYNNTRLQFLFAAPHLIAQIALEEWRQPEIWYHIFITFSEAALGLLFGTFLGTACGLLLWGNGRIDFIARPYLVFFGSIPIFALAPITIMWFGIGLPSKIIMAGFAVFFVSLLQAYEGAQVIASQYLSFARNLGAPNILVIRKIIIPGAIDWVIAGYKLNVGFALVGAFIAEFVSSEKGLGHYIIRASALYDMPRVLFGLFMLSLLGLLMTALAWFLQSRRQ